MDGFGATPKFLSWEDISVLMDQVERTDHTQIVAIFNRFRDMPLDEHYDNGVRKTVNVNTFCQRFRFHRQTFRTWLMKQQIADLAS